MTVLDVRISIYTGVRALKKQQAVKMVVGSWGNVHIRISSRIIRIGKRIPTYMPIQKQIYIHVHINKEYITYIYIYKDFLTPGAMTMRKRRLDLQS